MRAMQIVSYKSPLTLGNIGEPELPAESARIRMMANGVCATDVKMVDGLGFQPKLPFVPGHEPAGIVEDVNSDNESFRALIGKPVVIHPHVACGVCENCVSGHENICLSMKASYGINTNGGLQEYLAIAAKNLITLPGNITLDEGALAGGVVAVPLHGLKQLGSLLDRKVLVLGAGGLALAAIQIIKAMGGEAIVVGRKESKLDLAQSVGADVVINSTKTDYVEEVKKLTGPGVHAAVDLAGDNNEVPRLLQTVRRGGKVLIIGYSKKTFEGAYSRLALDGISIVGTRSYTRNDLRESVNMISRKLVKPIITETFPLEMANKALDLVRTGQSLGRVLVHPNE